MRNLTQLHNVLTFFPPSSQQIFFMLGDMKRWINQWLQRRPSAVKTITVGSGILCILWTILSKSRAVPLISYLDISNGNGLVLLYRAPCGSCCPIQSGASRTKRSSSDICSNRTVSNISQRIIGLRWFQRNPLAKMTCKLVIALLWTNHIRWFLNASEILWPPLLDYFIEAIRATANQRENYGCSLMNHLHLFPWFF